MAKLTRDVLVLSSGLSRRKGAVIGQGEVPDVVWQNWVEEGIVKDVAPAPAPLEIEPEVSPSPHDGDTQNSHDGQLRDLTDDQLKLMAKQLKIQSWHRMKRDKLIKRIEEKA